MDCTGSSDWGNIGWCAAVLITGQHFQLLLMTSHMLVAAQWGMDTIAWTCAIIQIKYVSPKLCHLSQYLYDPHPYWGRWHSMATHTQSVYHSSTIRHDQQKQKKCEYIPTRFTQPIKRLQIDLRLVIWRFMGYLTALEELQNEISNFTIKKIPIPEDCYHYDEVVMSTMASQIISLAIVYLNVYLGADQRKHQSSASLAWWPVNSPHKGPVTRKMFPFDDVIMIWCMIWWVSSPY